MTARFIVGDTRDVLATLPAGSVDLVFTSPPFLALRSYLPADHPDKGREIGSEPTPADFLDTLLDVVELCDRVLAPHGSLVFELGDTYSGSGGAGGDYGDGGLRDGQPKFKSLRRKNEGAPGWPIGKSLCGIPTLFAWSLAYGRNLLRPERTTEPWRIRNVVVWARPNPPVGELGDKVRPATSYLTVACKGGKRYFDLDAVRGPAVEPKVVRVGASSASRGISGGDSGNPDKERMSANPAGAPPLDYFIGAEDVFDVDTWEIATQPYKGSHYAVMPERLVALPIKAMCPPRGVVLDPFAGSGTTLAVAEGHGRDSIGIDLDARNADLARERVGMWLTVEEHVKEGAA